MNCIAEKKKLLMIITSMCAGLSTILLIMSVTSEHWLHTKERYKGDIKKLGIYPYNQTEVYISTNFGLWRACSKYIGKLSLNLMQRKSVWVEISMSCFNIFLECFQGL